MESFRLANIYEQCVMPFDLHGIVGFMRREKGGAWFFGLKLGTRWPSPSQWRWSRRGALGKRDCRADAMWHENLKAADLKTAPARVARKAKSAFSVTQPYTSSRRISHQRPMPDNGSFEKPWRSMLSAQCWVATSLTIRRKSSRQPLLK